MQEKEYTDIIPLLKHLCIVLQPFANTRNIKLDFTGMEQHRKNKEFIINYFNAMREHGQKKEIIEKYILDDH